MSWDIDLVKEAIDSTESGRSALVRQMKVYEEAWKLNFWSADQQRQARKEGLKLYTTPAPRNIVSLALSLINGQARVACPTYEATAEEIEKADKKSRFLELLIQRQAKVQEMGVIDALSWNAVVRGRIALQFAWIYDQMTPQQRTFAPPILIRPLDPMGVGIERDSLGVKWAYHKYKEKLVSAKTRYPDAIDSIFERQDPSADQEVTITDFWYWDKGAVWNAVLIDNEFAKKPKKTRYPAIPILERNNDPTPSADQRWRSAAIMEGMLDTWSEMNHLHSMHLTSVGKYFWPAIYYMNEQNEVVPPLDTGMGAINELPPGTQFTGPPQNKPDVALATSALEVLGKYAQESTFPDVMYGDPGNMRAAYGYNLMASTALRRIAATKDQLETILEGACELALWSVQTYAPNGVSVYGYNKVGGKAEQVSLTADDVNKHYDNTVVVRVEVPGADLQHTLSGMQLVDRRILSRGTFRRDWLPADKQAPPDEETRILVERIEDDPDLLRERLRLAYSEYYGYELPPGEPDFQATPQQPPSQQPQPMPMQQTMQGPPMQGQQGMMGGYESQGGISPEMLGLDPNDPNTPIVMQQMMQGTAPGPQDMALMLQDQFRRR